LARINAVIFGTNSVKQLEQNAEALLYELPEDVLNAIEEVHEQTRNPCDYYVNRATAFTAKWLDEKEQVWAGNQPQKQ
jgi:hypothetical protein